MKKQWGAILAFVVIVLVMISVGVDGYRNRPDVIIDSAPTSAVLPLADRFANLMEALSDNGTMLYDTEIRADLAADDNEPDTVSIIIRLAKGDAVR